jgi:hypothetical protein
MLIGRADRHLAGVGARADAVSEVAEDDQVAICKAADGAREGGTVGCRFRPVPAKILDGHATRIIHTALAGAGTMLLLCKQAEKNAALETA